MRKAIFASLSFKLSILLLTMPLFAPENNPPLASEEIRLLVGSLLPPGRPERQTFPFLQSSLRPEISLAGSAESLIWQNFKLDREGLKRINNDQELVELIDSGTLVPLPLGYCLTANDKELEPKWRFVLPQAAKFLQDFSETVCPEFQIPVQINSAVRHQARQLELIREGNLNAAPITGPKISPHLTGATVDIAVLNFPEEFVERLKEVLLELEDWGVLDATLETNSQVVLHVTVFEEYLGIPVSPN